MNHAIIYNNNNKKNRKMYHKKNHRKMESDDCTTSDGLPAKMPFCFFPHGFGRAATKPVVKNRVRRLYYGLPAKTTFDFFLTDLVVLRLNPR